MSGPKIVDGNQIKRFLFDLGHFNNPDSPTGVKRQDLDKVLLTSKEMADAIKSYQSFMTVELDRLSFEIHGRRAVIDGEPGPATRALFNLDRCMVPDYDLDEDGALAATGRGSWPAGCYTEYRDHHAITVFVDKTRMPSFLTSIFEKCWEWVAAAYRDMGIVLIRVTEKAKANLHFLWATLTGSTIGLAQVPRGPMCNAKYWCKFDPTYRPSDLFNKWCTLIAHEFGHNMGFSHTRSGILQPSIATLTFTKTAWRGDAAEPLFVRSFGGVAVPKLDSDPDPEPDPNPPSGEYSLRGTLGIYKGDELIEEFIPRVRPRV